MNSFEFVVYLAIGCCFGLSIFSMACNTVIYKMIKELNLKLPHSWNSDYFEFMNRTIEIEDEIVGLKDCIDDYHKMYTDNLAEHSRHIIKAVYERGDNTMADIASIMGDHKTEHDDLDKSIDIFTKAVSLSSNEIRNSCDELNSLRNDLDKSIDVFTKAVSISSSDIMNVRNELRSLYNSIDAKIKEVQNAEILDQNNEI
uniref:Uncharacterized protein n=1 Tax=Siphoviridae sp. ctgBD49 TaxID=2826420 RepID=A0A8S5QQ75_9CAUD|nr:MAG TPA: hypothetical protein [Siphoviridae sp. ctgBD49]